MYGAWIDPQGEIIGGIESFDDIKKRVPLLPDPEKMLIRRVIEELEDKDKYRVFVPRMERVR